MLIYRALEKAKTTYEIASGKRESFHTSYQRMKKISWNKKFWIQEIYFSKISFKNSHELRAPLVHILGIISLLKERISPGTDEKSLIEFLESYIKRLDLATRDINTIIPF